MKIGFDAKRAFKNNTGLGNYSRMIIRALAELSEENQLILYTPDVKGRYGDYFAECKNVSIVTPHGLWRLAPGLWRTFGITCDLRRRHLDVYHGLSHELPCGRVGDTNLVVSMHDLIVWRYPRHFPLVDRVIYKLKQRHACRRADAIVAISKQTERDLIDLLDADKDKIHVVYQSCDAIFRAHITDEQRVSVRQRYELPKKYLICVGTIERRKNQAAVVEALSLLPDEFHLVVVGKKTAYYDEVVEVVDRQGLNERVHFLNNVDFADFPALYSEAFVSVYMSIFEGFGIPVLESLCCGTPAVASSRSSIPEVGGDAAIYADPFTPEEIAGQINRLLSNSELYAELCRQSRQQVAKFEPKKIASDLLKLYKLVSIDR